MVETAERPEAKRKLDMNQYLLIGGRRNESWQVRTNNVFVLDGAGRRKQLQYSKGESSIYKEKHNKESKPTYIWFELGSLLVNPNDVTLNNYLQKHPDFNVKFYLYNEETESAKELEVLEAEDKIRLLLSELDDDKREAVATVLFGMTTVGRWRQSKIKLELMRYVKSNPKKLEEAILDPMTELIYLVAAAIKLKILEITADKTAIRWVDSKLEIIPIPRGRNPLQEMAQFLKHPDSLTTLQSIGERIEEKSARKIVKKTPAKKTAAKTAKS